MLTVVRNMFCCTYILSLLLSQFIYGEKLDYLSFEPPFADIDNSGARMINRDWRLSGSAVVNNNFVRLTPDRQSKKGAVWSRKSLGVPAFSIVFKFRISGKGKTFFGDGIALWIVQQGYYTDGDVHGFPEKFTGIGIIFDTFKNTEFLAAHRDVTILANDGEKTYELMTADVQGCNANFRYHSERADFSVTDATRAKITLEDRNLTISIDARNTGEWVECVSLVNIPLQHEWARRAYIGLTGTTGQLSDNHDVISLQTFSDFQVMEAHDAEQTTKKRFETASDYPVRDRLLRVEDTLNTILEKLDFLDHHLEHKIVTIEEHVSTLQTHVDRLEASHTDTTKETGNDGSSGDTLGDRVAKIEHQVESSLQNKLLALEASMNKRINASSGDSWRLPFFFLLVVILGSAVGLYMFYQRLKKMHML